jgi:hypothetical protein
MGETVGQPVGKAHTACGTSCRSLGSGGHECACPICLSSVSTIRQASIVTNITTACGFGFGGFGGRGGGMRATHGGVRPDHPTSSGRPPVRQ